MAEKYSQQRILSPRFNEAVSWALDIHACQYRKGTEIPYVSHLLAVTALVLEAGGTENEAIAAVLHDAVEDSVDVSVEDVRERFGVEVAEIVDGCTDAHESPKPPWKERKLAYIEHLKTAPESGLLVSLADKTHNARAIVADYKRHRDRIWNRFSAERGDIYWYYNSILDVMKQRASDRLWPLVTALDAAVEELAWVVDQEVYRVGDDSIH